MPKTLPSDVVKVIDRFFPDAASGSRSAQRLITYANASGVSALVELVERLPEETLLLSSEESCNLVVAIASLRHVVGRLEAGITSAGAGGGWPVPSFGSEDAISFLRRILVKCPDEGIRPSTSGLEFIDDEEFRSGLRRDLSSSETALNSGQWKAATVLGGSVLEALLLWAVMQHGAAERQSAVKNSQRKADPKRPEDWHLSDYIEVALELGDIVGDTPKQARLAMNFRNLIHPGREARKQMRCDRGTAHAAFAALNLVITDLEKAGASGA